MNVETDIPALEAAVSEQQLLQRALLDCIEAMADALVINRSMKDATILLDAARQQFEKGRRP